MFNFLILTLLGTGLLYISWHKWVNIMVDYGRELYIPWRITCGEVLYKDIASLFGPFSSYWNALLFKIFGASIMTLVIFNILLVIGITVLLYRFFKYTADQWSALCAGVAFLSMFALMQNNFHQGNHAYICPYTYSVTYAVFLSLWAMDRFMSYCRCGKDAVLWLIGILIGLCALSRFEIFTFLVLAIGGGLVLKGNMGMWTAQRFLGTGARVLGGFCIPVGIAYGYFATQMPLLNVGASIFGYNPHWPDIAGLYYYQHISGLDNPWLNFQYLLGSAVFYCIVIIALKCLCLSADSFEKGRKRVLGFIYALMGFCIMGAAIGTTFWDDGWVFRGVPLAVFSLAGYLFFLLFQAKKDEQERGRLLPLFVMAVWAILMLSKALLNVSIYNLGFVYAMPGIILFIVFFISWIPRYFERAHGRGYLVKVLLSVLFVFIVLAALKGTVVGYSFRNLRVQAGTDEMICSIAPYSSVGGAGVSAFLKDVDKIMEKDANFVVFPEGVMLNFLAKRRNPLPYNTFMPAEMIVYGEGEMLRSFKERKPDYVVFTNRSLIAYDLALGVDYAMVSMAWIWTQYQPVWRAHSDNGFILMVLKRLD